MLFRSDYLFANGGTDFAPIIEAYVTGGAKGSEMPEPMIIPHETAAVAMASVLRLGR